MTTQDLTNTLRQGKPMTDKLVREIVRELEDLKKLKEAVRPVAKWWNSSPDGVPMRLGATEIMGLVTRKEAEGFDALVNLVGEG